MKTPLTCFIIDDDDLDRFAVELEVERNENLKLAGSFGSCIEAIDLINCGKPDILFLDIDMPEINGLDLIKCLNDVSTINVIISSHPEFALQGFQLKVFDFILKPLETERFNCCVKRITEFVELKHKAQAYDVLFEQEHIIFKEGLNVVKLNVNSIIYLEAYGDYTKIVTASKVYLTLTTLSKFSDSLPIDKFLRIHRSYVVSSNKVESYNSKHVFINQTKLPVGKTYHKEIKGKFTFYLIK